MTVRAMMIPWFGIRNFGYFEEYHKMGIRIVRRF
jgi:hypothetical protein